LIATIVLSNIPTSKRDKVALNSGATNHIINALDWFILGMMQCMNGSVKLGNEKVL
jgi:hypothetical protein